MVVTSRRQFVATLLLLHFLIVLFAALIHGFGPLVLNRVALSTVLEIIDEVVDLGALKQLASLVVFHSRSMMIMFSAACCLLSR